MYFFEGPAICGTTSPPANILPKGNFLEIYLETNDSSPPGPGFYPIANTSSEGQQAPRSGRYATASFTTTVAQCSGTVSGNSVWNGLSGSVTVSSADLTTAGKVAGNYDITFQEAQSTSGASAGTLTGSFESAICDERATASCQ